MSTQSFGTFEYSKKEDQFFNITKVFEKAFQILSVFSKGFQYLPVPEPNYRFLTYVEVSHFGWSVLAPNNIVECKCKSSIFHDILHYFAIFSNSLGFFWHIFNVFQMQRSFWLFVPGVSVFLIDWVNLTLYRECTTYYNVLHLVCVSTCVTIYLWELCIIFNALLAPYETCYCKRHHIFSVK